MYNDSPVQIVPRTPLRLLSVVIPARDEAGCIASTIEHLHLELSLRGIPHEIIVVNDGSTDSTWEILQSEAVRLNKPDILAAAKPDGREENPLAGQLGHPWEPSGAVLKPIHNQGPHGFGRAIVCGLDAMSGDAVVIMMADESDDSRDVVRYWKKLNEGYDCVFGSRFMKGGGVIDYPPMKMFINRCANLFISLLFQHGLNDTTNAFKAYRKAAIDGMRPIISAHFNVTVELPLKAIVRGFGYTVIPITWRNRLTGVAKLKIKEMGSRYLFICLYLWLERYFSQGDYRKTP